MKVYMECSGCHIHEWVGEIWQLTIEDDSEEPSELTFHSRQCLLDWLTADGKAGAGVSIGDMAQSLALSAVRLGCQLCPPFKRYLIRKAVQWERDIEREQVRQAVREREAAR